MASPIEISDSDDDDDIKKAIAMSLKDNPPATIRPEPPAININSDKAEPTTQHSQDSYSTISEPHRMNLAALREARMARFGGPLKRERSISPPELSRPTKILKTNAIQSPPSINATPHSIYQATAIPSSQESLPTLSYAKGVIKKTWARGYERTGIDIKIEEVLERQTLRTAILSAFQWNPEWVLSRVDFPSTKLIWIKQAKMEADRKHDRAIIEGMESSLELCFPPMDGQINCMHSKLMLLFHAHKLRVVVPSANLMDYDWGETGVMENTVFLIDLPRLANGEKVALEDLTPFGKELLYFLEKQGLSDKAREGVLSFDFSATKELAFVHAVGGVSYGEEMQRTGYMGLSKAVKDLGLQTTEDLQIDFAAASLGSLNDGYLQTLHAAARGDLSNTKTLPKLPETIIPDNFRIYFPTLGTVQASNGGTDKAGTVCFQRSWYESGKFPQKSLRDYRSGRKGMLSHNKILYARGTNTDGKSIAWAYVGSANLSESAWGKVSMDKQRKELKISCRNWECGVMIPVKTAADGQEAVGLPEMSVFDGVVDVPFTLPAEKYNGKQPWFFKER